MRAIVDAHHHLWDLEACSYPWLTARGVKRFFGDPTPIQKNYLVPDFRKDAAKYDLQASVHVQVGVEAGDEVRETMWLEYTAEQFGLPSAIVAYCDLADPEAQRVLEAQMKHGRVRGVRQIIGRSKEEDARTNSGTLIDQPEWLVNFEMLGELGLSFDLQLTPGQVPKIADVLADAPGTAVALCHCGSPWDQSPTGLAGWREGLRLLASLPNVFCKISGLGMFKHDWVTDDVRPIVETCIDIFGAERSMFGSNFPVDKLHASYSKVWGAFEEITASLDANDQNRLFGETAREFYGIE